MFYTKETGPGELRESLLRLTYINSYRSGRFLLSSGRTSHYYIDGKQVLMTPEGLHGAATYILRSLQENRIEVHAVGGLTLGADPIAAAVCTLSLASPHYRPLDCFIVRKETKSHGTASRIEGPSTRGQPVLIVDDVLTTGASVISAAMAAMEAGASVSAAYVLVDRQEGGREALRQAGVRLEAILCREDLEALQRQLENRYPRLVEALQAEKPPWGDIPWTELPREHEALRGALTGAGAFLGRRFHGDSHAAEAEKKAAQRLLSAVKAAALHPRGEEEGLRLIARLLQEIEAQ